MDKTRIDELRKKTKKRKRNRLLRLLAVVVFIIAVIIAVILGIKSVVNLIVESIPTPSPTPVPIVSQNGELVTQNEETDETVTEAAVPVYAELPDASVQNDLLAFLEQSATDKKVCYLTFDDGPNKSVTLSILDVLRRYNIKATFFQVGTLIQENPDVAQRIYKEGHLLANHSYDHNYNKIYGNHEGFVEEFNNCAEEIKKITGDDYFPLMRFPGGSYNSGKHGAIKQELKTVLAENGVFHCDWNALNGDAEGSSKSAEQLLERVKTSSKGKNQLVILMHDAATKKQTVDALPDIIEYLMSEGYIFSTLDKPIFE